jgi:hypothetical protein
MKLCFKAAFLDNARPLLLFGRHLEVRTGPLPASPLKYVAEQAMAMIAVAARGMDKYLIWPVPMETDGFVR